MVRDSRLLLWESRLPLSHVRLRQAVADFNSRLAFENAFMCPLGSRHSNCARVKLVHIHARLSCRVYVIDAFCTDRRPRTRNGHTEQQIVHAIETELS